MNLMTKMQPLFDIMKVFMQKTENVSNIRETWHDSIQNVWTMLFLDQNANFLMLFAQYPYVEWILYVYMYVLLLKQKVCGFLNEIC